MYTIYQIINKVNGKCYVGLTSKTIKQRWSSHVASSVSGHYYLHHAIRKYGVNSFEIKEIEKTELLETAYILEKQWIAFHISNNPIFGYNMTLGGDGCLGHVLSENAKAKISEAMRTRIVSLETRLKHSQTIKGRKLSPDQIAKIVKANTGKIRSESFKQKISKINFGRKRSDETKLRLAEIGRKRVFSKETREKIAAAGRGRKMSPKTRAALLKSNINRGGKPWSFNRKAKFKYVNLSDYLAAFVLLAEETLNE